MTDPTITVLDPDDPKVDGYYIRENLSAAAKHLAENLPPLYQDAVASTPDVRTWVTKLVESASEATSPCPIVTTGPSLLILGPIGAGKTYEAFGAIRAIAMSGAACGWELLTAADIYARLRPRHRIDPEVEFNAIANSTLLVIDDLGAAKATEWTEEVNYRVINHRYQWRKPTLITSNVPPAELGRALGQRVASRLTEMATPVVLDGADRRRTMPVAS